MRADLQLLSKNGKTSPKGIPCASMKDFSNVGLHAPLDANSKPSKKDGPQVVDPGLHLVSLDAYRI
jgi:hypothetical protein